MAEYFGPYFGVGSTPTTATAEWFYASQTDVEDRIGVVALQKISNEPGAADDTATDTARVTRIGELIDQYIDSRMASLGYVAPMEVSDVLVNALATTHRTRALMRDISVGLVVWKLNEPRLLTSISGSRQANAIDKIMAEHRKVAEANLNKIAMRTLAITADRLYTRPAFGEVYIPTWAETVPLLA